jgi:Fe2+ transport system protein FeoA
MSTPTTLDRVPLAQTVTIVAVGGERAFRRRLLEMGLVPGTRVTPVNVAPLGDPIEIAVMDGRLSIRRHEAMTVTVSS